MNSIHFKNFYLKSNESDKFVFRTLLFYMRIQIISYLLYYIILYFKIRFFSYKDNIIIVMY